MSLSSNTTLSAIRKLYRIFSHKQKADFAWLVIYTFLSSVGDLLGLSLIIPLIAIVLSDGFYNNVSTALPFGEGLSKQTLLLYTSLLFFAVMILKNLFSMWVNRQLVNFVQQLYISASERALNNVYSKSLSEIQQTHSNEYATRLSYHQSAFCTNTALPILIILNEAIIFLLTLTVVAVWNWQLLVLLLAIAGPVTGVFYYRAKTTIKEAGYQKQQGILKLYKQAQNMIFGYTDIKIAGTEAAFRKQFMDTAYDLSKHQRKTDFLIFIPAKIIEMAIFLCAIIILLYEVYVVKDMAQIVTTLSLFSVIAYRITPSINRIVSAMNNINGTAFILNHPDFAVDIPHSSIAAEPLPFCDTIIFDRVSYRYSEIEPYVLKDCSFTIQKGTVTGIIGKSGAGKSTLIKNLLGYLQPVSGNICIDDTALTTQTIPAWWQQLGYVRQDVFIMNATLAENIALGIPRDEIDMRRLQQAITFSNLNELVAGRTEGVDMCIAEAGNNLSGGQKQRIAIARAIYKGAQVLIFDEATSSLDARTEQEITASIKRLQQEDLTIIIIAHRLTSLQHCSTIFELENGHIANSYTYAELTAV